YLLGYNTSRYCSYVIPGNGAGSTSTNPQVIVTGRSTAAFAFGPKPMATWMRPSWVLVTCIFAALTGGVICVSSIARIANWCLYVYSTLVSNSPSTLVLSSKQLRCH